jgi:hypothetical protein
MAQSTQTKPPRVFDLEQPRTPSMPIHPAHKQGGYHYLLHRRHTDSFGSDGPRSGIYIIENLKLGELAAAGAYEFEFVCAPLKLVGATGSPVRPVAIAR